MSIRVLALLLFASGSANFVYQLLWVRTFARLFGDTAHSASLVTVIFIGGLAIGAYAFGRWVDGRREAEALRAFAHCQLGIAAGAGLVAAAVEKFEPWAASLSAYALSADGWYRLTFGSYALQYVGAVAMLTPVAVLIGGTLSLLVRSVVVAGPPRSGWNVGLLLGANAAGAATAALATDLVLVPRVGIIGTQSLAAVVNLVVAWIVLRATTKLAPHRPRACMAAPSTGAGASSVRSVATVLLLTGFIGMGLELIWFRYIGVTLGVLRSVFSMLLAVTFLGAAAGAVFAGDLQRRTRRPVTVFLLAQTGLVVSALGSLAAFDGPTIILAARHVVSSPNVFNLVPIAALTAVPSFFMGFAYPIANACVQTSAATAGRRAGVLYAAYAVGAAAGLLVFGFVVTPRLGTQASVAVMGFIGIASIVHLWALEGGVTRWHGPVSAAAAALAVGLWLSLPADRFQRAGLPSAARTHALVASSQGFYELISVTEGPGGERALNTNGRLTARTTRMSERHLRALSHVPLLMQDGPSDVLVVGFGIGATAHAASLHPSVSTLDVAEVSEEVLRHGHHFAEINGNVLFDPRMRVFINDGRKHLRMQPSKRYDLVTLEPPPITSPGVASLHSTEFLALVNSRLKPGGLISQWLPAYQMTTEAIRSVVRAFLDEFPTAVLLSGRGRELIMLGQRDGPTTLHLERFAANLAARPAVQEDLSRVYLGTLTELVGTFVAGARAMHRASEGIPPVQDDLPSIEHAVVSSAYLASHLPLELTDVGAIRRWCPECFTGGRPHRLTPRLGEYLVVQNAYYRRPLFWQFDATKTPPTSVRFPRNIGRAVIDDSEFLARFFEFEGDPRLSIIVTATSASSHRLTATE